eukprot:4573010-Pyramimonas_sp.AAC.1
MPISLSAANTRVFFMALNTTEKKYLAEYVANSPSGCIHKLNQNPGAGRGASSSPTEMHCIIKNTAIDWSTAHQRWLAPSELLTAQCIPTDCLIEKLLAKVSGGKTMPAWADSMDP